MNLKDYFESSEGMGILATSDSKGKVDIAMYSRPHFIDEENCVFLMADKLSHKNLQENPKAAFAFIQKGAHYQGKRLYLSKTEESDNTDLAEEFRRKSHNCKDGSGKKTFVVYFKIDTVRPLVGGKM